MKGFKVRDRRGHRRYFIDNALLRGGWGKAIGPYGIAVYNALALHADADTQDAWPSYKTIADLTGMSRRQVIAKMKQLEELGIIAKQSRFTEDEQTSNMYYLIRKEDWRAPPSASGTPPSEQDAPKQDPCNKEGDDDLRHHSAQPKEKPASKNPLAPETEPELLLFRKYNAERAKAHYGKCKKFPNNSVRQKFRAAADKLGDNLDPAIDAAFLAGINSLPKIVAYIAKWRPDGPHRQFRNNGGSFGGPGERKASLANGMGQTVAELLGDTECLDAGG
jgi:hypothetical protein